MAYKYNTPLIFTLLFCLAVFLFLPSTRSRLDKWIKGKQVGFTHENSVCCVRLKSQFHHWTANWPRFQRQVFGSFWHFPALSSVFLLCQAFSSIKSVFQLCQVFFFYAKCFFFCAVYFSALPCTARHRRKMLSRKMLERQTKKKTTLDRAKKMLEEPNSAQQRIKTARPGNNVHIRGLLYLWATVLEFPKILLSPSFDKSHRCIG